jgi:hypothetical protein
MMEYLENSSKNHLELKCGMCRTKINDLTVKKSQYEKEIKEKFLL